MARGGSCRVDRPLRQMHNYRFGSGTAVARTNKLPFALNVPSATAHHQLVVTGDCGIQFLLWPSTRHSSRSPRSSHSGWFEPVGSWARIAKKRTLTVRSYLDLYTLTDDYCLADDSTIDDCLKRLSRLIEAEPMRNAWLQLPLSRQFYQCLHIGKCQCRVGFI